MRYEYKDLYERHDEIHKRIEKQLRVMRIILCSICIILITVGTYIYLHHSVNYMMGKVDGSIKILMDTLGQAHIVAVLLTIYLPIIIVCCIAKGIDTVITDKLYNKLDSEIDNYLELRLFDIIDDHNIGTRFIDIDNKLLKIGISGNKVHIVNNLKSLMETLLNYKIDLVKGKDIQLELERTCINNYGNEVSIGKTTYTLYEKDYSQINWENMTENRINNLIKVYEHINKLDADSDV